jgi:type VI secretion system secreted protein VgrG
MAKVTQENRILSLLTPLGKDKLLADTFAGSEGISQLFRYELAVLAEEGTIDPARLIGQGATITLELGGEAGKRYYHGIITQFSHGEGDEIYSRYHMVLVPWFWLLTQTADCRIYQGLSVPDIIDKLFAEYGFKDYKKAFDASKYTKWDYCVQYRETDFNFLSRLMQQEGLFYWFEHAQNKHTLVIADDLQKCPPCPGQAKAHYYPFGGFGEKREDSVSTFRLTQSLRPGKYTYRDYHFEKPRSTLDVNRNASVKVANDKLEVYDYPGEYAQRFNKPTERLDQVIPEGEKLVKIRMEEEESPLQVVEGSSTCGSFLAGGQFELLHHPTLSGKYALTGVDFSVSQMPAYYSRDSEGEPYKNTFTALPLQTAYRPPRVTPKPVVQGLQSAVVVGLEGKEIDVDQYGRVKVQFHWDREGQKNQKSSCWIRVAQFWAGKRWGASFWPRIGQEVLVAFLEGDPDQPIIVGSVYNAEQLPPYLGDPARGQPSPDPKHAHDPHLAGIKTNTTLGGEGFNEVRFDDTRDKQQLFMHAERNMDVRVKNDTMELVGANRHLLVGSLKGKGDQLEKVFQDKHLHVLQDHIELIDRDMKLTISGNADLLTEGDKKEQVNGESHLIIKGNLNEQVDGTQSLTVKGNLQEKVTGKHALEAPEIHLKGTMNVVIEAGMQLTLKVGGNFVSISPAGVDIQGTMVKINSGGAPGSGSGSSPTAPAAAKKAQPKDPAEADDAKSGKKSAP